MNETDRIEKKVTLRAPRPRVWRAITNAKEFGTWFRVNMEGEFAEGSVTRGNITYPGYEHLTMELLVVRIQPESYFAYRWHPYAVDAAIDYSSEPMTLVEFRLEETKEGTVLTIVESGFDQIPMARRKEAFRMNDGGWAEQTRNIERYVAGA